MTFNKSLFLTLEVNPLVEEIYPNGDVDTSNWTGVGAGTGLWGRIDDVSGSADDNSTKVSSDSVADGAGVQTYDFEVDCETPTSTPIGGQTVTVVVKAQYDAGGATDGEYSDMTIEVKEGTTVRSTSSVKNLTTSWAFYTHTLTSGEISSITDWGSVRINISCEMLAPAQPFASIFSEVTQAFIEFRE